MKFKVFSDRKSAVIFLACLLLSAVFWFLLSLSEESQETLILKVEYRNLPEDKVLVEALPNTVNVLVRSEGFNLLGYKLGFTQNDLVVDLKDLSFHQKGVYYHATWLSSKNLNTLNTQEGKFTVLSIFPDTIKIVMDKKVSKVLPVKFSGKSKRFPNLRIVGDVQIAPDSVHVTGGLNWLKKCTVIYTDSLDLLSSDEGLIERKVPLKLLDGATALEGKTVQVKLLVQSMKSRKMEINIRSINVPKGEELKLLPGTVQLSFLSTDSAFNELSRGDFIAVADYNDLVFSQDKIEVQLIRIPKDIELPKITPAKVEYILRRQ